jgi:hypothetical protein
MKGLKSLPYFSYRWPCSGKFSVVSKDVVGRACLQYGYFLLNSKGHSRICGTVIFGFTKTGVMKQTRSAAHHILTAFIVVDL